MRNKIEAMIALVSFSAVSGAHIAIIPALLAFEYSKDSTVGFWVYVASLIPSCMVSMYFFVHIAAFAADRLEEKGQWITVESSGGSNKKRVYVPPKVYTMGKRDHEAEQYFIDRHE